MELSEKSDPVNFFAPPEEDHHDLLIKLNTRPGTLAVRSVTFYEIIAQVYFTFLKKSFWSAYAIFFLLTGSMLGIPFATAHTVDSLPYDTPDYIYILLIGLIPLMYVIFCSWAYAFLLRYYAYVVKGKPMTVFSILMSNSSYTVEMFFTGSFWCFIVICFFYLSFYLEHHSGFHTIYNPTIQHFLTGCYILGFYITGVIVWGSLGIKIEYRCGILSAFFIGVKLILKNFLAILLLGLYCALLCTLCLVLAAACGILGIPLSFNFNTGFSSIFSVLMTLLFPYFFALYSAFYTLGVSRRPTEGCDDNPNPLECLQNS